MLQLYQGTAVFGFKLPKNFGVCRHPRGNPSVRQAPRRIEFKDFSFNLKGAHVEGRARGGPLPSDASIEIEFAEMVAIVLSPPFHGLLGVGESFENAIRWSSDEDFGCDRVVVGTDLRNRSDTECGHEFLPSLV